MPPLSDRAFIARRSVVALLGVASWIVTTPARADVQSCIDAHVEAQRAQRDHKLRAAKASLLKCAAEECPTAVVSECSHMLEDVERATPTLVFEVRDERGTEVVEASVFDGEELLTERIDGKAVAIDPGEHTFTAKLGPDKEITTAPVTLVVREGEQARLVVLGKKAEDKPAASGGGPHPAFWAVGALGVVGLGLFAGLGGAGLAARADLDEQNCKPNCDPDEVDRIRALFLGADISLGVGAAALVTATILYFALPAPSSTAAASVRVGLDVATAALAGDDRGLVFVSGAF
ncbi:MAG: hypothetical protein U0271_10450 [Polyangiaceae bacterium]